MSGGERATRPSELGDLPSLTDREIEELEARNVLFQFDRVIAIIEKATCEGAPRYRLRPSLFGELQRIAVDGLEPSPGTFRTVPVGISGSDHQPPPPHDVPRFVEELCDYINDNWDAVEALHLGGLRNVADELDSPFRERQRAHFAGHRLPCLLHQAGIPSCPARPPCPT